jgi:Fe-S-cluster containining protein
MNCRIGCGACCIALSISSPIPDMPDGKPAGVRCPQRSPDNRCLVFGKPERPAVCREPAAAGRDVRTNLRRSTRISGIPRTMHRYFLLIPLDLTSGPEILEPIIAVFSLPCGRQSCHRSY